MFAFFADARNLERLTPPWLRFETLTPSPIEMKPGALIRYRIRWRLHFASAGSTEIAEWQPPARFVDVQQRGPYALWHHTHTFAPEVDGTRIPTRSNTPCRWASSVPPLTPYRFAATWPRIFDYREQARRRNLRRRRRHEIALGRSGTSSHSGSQILCGTTIVLSHRLILGTLFIAALVGLCWLDWSVGWPGIVLFPLAVVLALVAANELLAMFRQRGHDPTAWAIYVGTLLTVLAAGARAASRARHLSREASGRLGWLAIGLALSLLIRAIAEMRRFTGPVRRRRISRCRHSRFCTSAG